MEIWKCPFRGDRPPTETSYVAVVGPNTAWGRRPDEIADGLSNTILMVEFVDSGIAWMEPRDLDARQVARLIHRRGSKGAGHTHGFHVVFADGTTRFIESDDISVEELQALVTIDGGENVSGW
jgi:hypothetical protein